MDLCALCIRWKLETGSRSFYVESFGVIPYVYFYFWHGTWNPVPEASIQNHSLYLYLCSGMEYGTLMGLSMETQTFDVEEVSLDT